MIFPEPVHLDSGKEYKIDIIYFRDDRSVDRTLRSLYFFTKQKHSDYEIIPKSTSFSYEYT